MHGSARVIGIAALAAAPLLGSFPSAALADGGCGTPGRPACTVLRPLPPAGTAATALGAGDCVLQVGGLSSTSEGTARAFSGLVGDLDGVRVETLEYDTVGKIAAGAELLRARARDLAGSCAVIHVVAHSMGGVVADRAFSKGLSGTDRIATYIPLSSPHNGAFAARQLCGFADMDPNYTEFLRRVAELLDLLDPGADAVCDLARVVPPRPPRDVSTVRLRLVTDPLVLRRDHASPHVDVRELLPSQVAELEGHGGIFRSSLARSIVRTSIAERAVPSDQRSDAYRIAAAVIAREADAALAVVHEGVGDLVWDGAIVSWLWGMASEIIEEVRSYVVVMGPTVFSYLGSSGPALLPR